MADGGLNFNITTDGGSQEETAHVQNLNWTSSESYFGSACSKLYLPFWKNNPHFLHIWQMEAPFSWHHIIILLTSCYSCNLLLRNDPPLLPKIPSCRSSQTIQLFCTKQLFPFSMNPPCSVLQMSSERSWDPVGASTRRCLVPLGAC